jgi:hypothetical protein
MAFYLKGIGNEASRINEILPSLDAKIYKFFVGHYTGIIKGFGDFAATAIDRGVVIKNGTLQAHGYFGCSDTDTQFNFMMPAITGYVHIYAEIDLSVVPNRFEIKATAMSNSNTWTPRQDDLSAVISGKYQFPLWDAALTASNIVLTDRRAYIEKLLNAANAEQSTTQSQADDSTKIATTTFTQTAAGAIKK